MRKLYIFGLIALAAIIIGLAWADQMTFTTYYPAPYGVYREMKVNLLHTDPLSVRPIPPLGEEVAWEGKFYYDDGTTEYPKGLYCHDGSDWRPVGGGGGNWTLSGTNLYTNDSSITGTNWDVGIGTQNPSARLDVNGRAEINGTLDMVNSTSNRIINLMDPQNKQDAATKKYVDDRAGPTGPYPFSVRADGNRTNSIVTPTEYTSCSCTGVSYGSKDRAGDVGCEQCSVTPYPSGGRWILKAYGMHCVGCDVTCHFECWK